MKPPDFIRRIGGALPLVALAAALLGTIGSPLGIWSSQIERMSHFRLWWIGLLLLLTLGFARDKRRLTSLLALIAAVMATRPLLPYWTPSPAVAAGSSKGLSFKVTAWNLLWENPDKSDALAWLQTGNEDVLLLTECTSEWMKFLEPLERTYPHRIHSRRDGAEGMWLLSRHPLDQPDPEGLAKNKPWISVIIHTPLGPVRFVGMHPRTPRSGPRFLERNEQYDRIASVSAMSPLPVIVAGDLNCTPFSPWFGRFLERGKLEDTALGRGLQGTWSSSGIRLPIDHILASPDWLGEQRQVHPDRMGSDHHPVIAVLSMADPQK
ncbi:endonuclease/exonuclease/phosphatase family protein [Luteolibacter sp. GHJ8]|uniref:Endonuclease/exonuclease/phosphatase family protein n=1 Tax=Luteolibacter rhizosphaerae TaxID=2989719 RepID=A0ABT3G3Z5_9BACT|nr:endonuclease/exonuclease/phosphatase family protein [Luteolibacter rhizosphaerae]MCW1914274.1 endonuclease/exonuclease/phosphatase family protein [Luteolibacter rhizosphaerae]